ncbi:hypothetical protein [Xenorhabdus innexi]|uniref:Uncharacterized protein n=1 Tax=Xenorhabdus innexi TaxID=290109 RepID=A0A1N6N1R4_9GAMM|nr:hypothetical protein [Xenorhabdus innexi]PHM37241.1 hypothetical protein Xinn_01208 [Xenorhabdus innexi]SIP74974.1 hypothetical protein XIS1_900009 [Xenorhabdus innexi]
MLENILEDAIKYARSIYRGKTSNKYYRDISKLPEHKRVMYTRDAMIEKGYKFKKLRDETNEMKLIKDIHQYALSRSNAGEKLVGNCGDLSISVFYYLANQRRQEILRSFNDKRNKNNETQSIYVLYIESNDPYDHAFVTVNLPKYPLTLPKVNNIYEPSFYNSWVCDAWANIVCPYIEYITRWKTKMLRWHLVGKSVSVYQEEQRLGYPTPLRRHNYHAITLSSKNVVYIAEIRPDGTMTISQ